MGMNRREFIKNTALASVGGFLVSGDFFKINAARRGPNVILIMADDLGFEALRCYGGDINLNSGESYQTPRLDALAASGIRFTHAYSQPLCTPSRVQIMTGRYNFRNYFSFGAISARETTFGHVMKKAGYETCIAGKWQLYGGGDGMYPDRAGFDEYCLWSLETPGDRYADPTYRKNGVLYQDMVGQYGPDVFTDFIIDFIDRKKDKSFFVYFPMALTHSPFMPTPDSPEWPDNRFANSTEFFPDMVAYMDKLVGRIVDALDQKGLREDTLVIFTGDNGTSQLIQSQMQDGSTFDGGKGYTDDRGTHVAFIANWPGTAPSGLVTDALVDFTDLMPTCADLAHAELPANTKIDGHSLAPLLRGEKFTPREWVFCWNDPMMSQDKYPLTINARDHRWKLYDSGELYDVENDLTESNPIDPAQAGPEAQEARIRLQKVLDEMGY